MKPNRSETGISRRLLDLRLALKCERGLDLPREDRLLPAVPDLAGCELPRLFREHEVHGTPLGDIEEA